LQPPVRGDPIVPVAERMADPVEVAVDIVVERHPPPCRVGDRGDQPVGAALDPDRLVVAAADRRDPDQPPVAVETEFTLLRPHPAVAGVVDHQLALLEAFAAAVRCTAVPRDANQRRRIRRLEDSAAPVCLDDLDPASRPVPVMQPGVVRQLPAATPGTVGRDIARVVVAPDLETQRSRQRDGIHVLLVFVPGDRMDRIADGQIGSVRIRQAGDAGRGFTRRAARGGFAGLGRCRCGRAQRRRECGPEHEHPDERDRAGRDQVEAMHAGSVASGAGAAYPSVDLTGPEGLGRTLTA